MKIKYKLILITVLFFIVTINIVAGIAINQYNSLFIQREIKTAKNEMNFIMNSIENYAKDLQARGGIYNKDTLISIIEIYKKYYISQDISLDYSDDNMENNVFIDTEEGNIIIQSIFSEPFESISLVFKKSFQDIYDLQKNWNSFFIKIYLLLSIILAIVLMLIISRLFKPLDNLIHKTDEIIIENSNERIPIIDNDEVGELSTKFNIMLDLLNENMETIKESSIQKQWLLDNLTHEMRTPLTSIQGFSEYLMRANASEEDKLVALTHINEEANRLKQLGDKMFALMTLKKESLNIVKLNSYEVFNTIRRIEFQRLKEMNIDLKVNIQADYFYGDEQLILVLLTNLVDNSINASKYNSRIEVDIYSKDDKNIIKVSDEGQGIDSKDLSNIFQPFYKADKNRSAIYRGAGLGLSLCKKIVELHDGSIEVESQKDIGTTIYVSLKSI
ncbi:sensor histidine kinase [Lutispora thermophila]|uniref:histidine kinase n=1 Tax=Lutispora thermophila DSM 19022 TaxID=1122184 RepID=A0A1M6C1X2_9FIRM|nr:HAMP domain-containing sensor histidine kinase [Lutispora thermophila]SHI54942.1 Signal transduction histidine kinase [Lutispora thermophila DSM 19022]